jgi:hypothetical protein
MKENRDFFIILGILLVMLLLFVYWNTERDRCMSAALDVIERVQINRR